MTATVSEEACTFQKVPLVKYNGRLIHTHLYIHQRPSLRTLSDNPPENISDAAGDEELHVPRVMVEETIVGEVDGERGVVGVGRLVVRLRARLPDGEI